VSARIPTASTATRRRRSVTAASASRRSKVAMLAVGAAVALLFLLPLWWVVASALRTQTETFRTLSPVSLWTIVPRDVTLDNFTRLFHGDFGRAILNSIIVASVSVVVGLVICATAAFALAVLRFPGRTALFAIMVVSFLIPFDAIAIPLSSIFREAGLADTYAGLILPGLANGFAVFLLRSFFIGVPVELGEAARVDGLGWWGIFFRIYLPLSKPALIGAGLILFVFQWQSYLWPLLIAPDPSMKVAPVAIAQFAGQYGVDFGRIFAGSVLTAIVPLIVLLFFQRYFTQSVATSGVKG
jgi:multiple sugar transport system permease protein/putative chitobiose transport system permease protein